MIVEQLQRELDGRIRVGDRRRVRRFPQNLIREGRPVDAQAIDRVLLHQREDPAKVRFAGRRRR
jgi:hypothetical protein